MTEISLEGIEIFRSQWGGDTFLNIKESFIGITNEISLNRAKYQNSKKYLVEETKKFKLQISATADPSFMQLIKLYQEEIDELTTRSK